MMKKMLVLMMVLGLVSVANASVVISVSGPATIVAGTTASYAITLTGDDIGSFDLDFGASNGLATTGNVAIVAAGRDAGIDYIGTDYITYDFEVVGASGIGGAITVGNLVTFDMTAGSTLGFFDLMVANIWVDTPAGADANPTFNALSGIEIVVPEPITVALLGLGCLFIRRRK